MPTFAQLNQKHPSVDVSELSELRALYEGGARFRDLLTTFLPARPHEVSERHELRRKEAVYRNYVGPIIDYFASMLFLSRTVSKARREGETVDDPGEYWARLREDCDRGGSDLDDFFKRVLTDAMVGRVGWVRLHQPGDATATVESRADFDSQGLGDCWLEHLDAADVYDWDTGDDGRLLWAVVHRKEARRIGLSGDRKTISETWDYLTPDTVEHFGITYQSDKPPQPDDQIPRLGQPEPHRFGRVPLVCLDIPIGLWVASRLKTPQLAHFRLSNAQTWGMSATCYAMPVFKLAQDAEGNFRKPTMGAGYGIYIGQDDDFAWAAPPGTPFEALGKEISSQKDEIFRIAHQMALGVENNAAAVGRSAESKASDAESTRVVLVAFSRIVRETIEYTLDLISANRGEEFEWSVEGLDDFAALDAAAFLENLKLLKESGRVIPSKTFATAINERAAELFLPHMDEQTKAKVREEIQAGTLDPAEERDLELAATSGLFQSPSGAERPGADAREGEAGSGGDRGRPEKREKPPRKPPSE